MFLPSRNWLFDLLGQFGESVIAISALHWYLVPTVLLLTYNSQVLSIDLGPRQVHAQAVPLLSETASDVQTPTIATGLVPSPFDQARQETSGESEDVTSNQMFLAPMVRSSAPNNMDFFEMIGESIFGHRAHLWEPLTMGDILHGRMDGALVYPSTKLDWCPAAGLD